MSGKSPSDLAKKMREIDITMLSTHAENGAIAGRPMSNNGEVDYDGDSYYFTWELPHGRRHRARPDGIADLPRF
jgi:general stress protein 26